MAAKAPEITFALDNDTGKINWFWAQNKPDVTEQQALVIGVTDLANAMRSVADGLHDLARAIEFQKAQE